MTKRETNSGVQDLRFFLSQPHPCGYLPQRQAVSLFTDPLFTIRSTDYGQLIDNGFRRSGPHFYRPECPNCNACVPLRISISSFKPNRSQRRTWRCNHDLEVRSHIPYSSPALFDLYKHYLNQRHTDGGMDNPKEDDFLNFMVCQGIHTLFYEFYYNNKLMAVAVVDKLQHGLSAVYTFFDPKQRSRSLGIYAVLWIIEEARRLDLQWVYLGYWIADCEKMNYKKRFQPAEMYCNGLWVPFLEKY